MTRTQLNALIDVLLTLPNLSPEVVAALRAMRAADPIDFTRAAYDVSAACAALDQAT